MTSYCINPDCKHPKNPKVQLFCHACNSELLLEGQYLVLRKLGGGGFCYTYEVEDEGELKVLKVLHMNDPIALRLFKQESVVLRKFNHPGIPRVEPNSFFTVKIPGKKDPLYCFLMEKIEGTDLDDWLQQRGKPIDQKLALKWLKQIVYILQEVHNNSFFHRDIKPSNIMLRPNGQLTLIDFGTAKEITATLIVDNNVTPSGTLIDSPGYSPGEQKNGHITSKSDFFALGRTFVHLLTRQHPHDFYDINSGELNWHFAAKGVSPLLKNFIDELMAHLPANRPANCQEILKRITELEQSLTETKKTEIDETKILGSENYDGRIGRENNDESIWNSSIIELLSKSAITGSISWLLVLSLVSFFGVVWIGSGLWLAFFTIFTFIKYHSYLEKIYLILISIMTNYGVYILMRSFIEQETKINIILLILSSTFVAALISFSLMFIATKIYQILIKNKRYSK